MKFVRVFMKCPSDRQNTQVKAIFFLTIRVGMFLIAKLCDGQIVSVPSGRLVVAPPRTPNGPAWCFYHQARKEFDAWLVELYEQARQTSEWGDGLWMRVA